MKISNMKKELGFLVASAFFLGSITAYLTPSIFKDSKKYSKISHVSYELDPHKGEEFSLTKTLYDHLPNDHRNPHFYDPTK